VKAAAVVATVSPVERVSLAEALRRREEVLRAFLDPDGTLRAIPARHAKRLVVLDHLAQQFEPGKRYSELEVNRRLRVFHDDVAALRRYLIEDGFLDRESGEYWRIGGSVDVDPDLDPDLHPELEPDGNPGLEPELDLGGD
jgi:hypothetical protein